MRAALESVRADLQAEVARHISERAEADVRHHELQEQFERRVTEDDARHENALHSLREELLRELSTTRGTINDARERTDVALAEAKSMIEAQAAALSAVDSEGAAALNTLGLRVEQGLAELSTRLATGLRGQATILDALTSDQATTTLRMQLLDDSLTQIEARYLVEFERTAANVSAQIGGASREHSEQLRETEAAMAERLVEVQAVHALELASVIAAQRALGERNVIVDGSIERIQARLTSAVKRVEVAASAAVRVDELGDLVDQIRDRLVAAETILLQRDATDIELQLDRMESFERLAVESDPALFAAKAELDELRARLSEIERHVQAPADA